MYAMTIKEIAKLADVSPSTILMVLNERPASVRKPKKCNGFH